MHIIRKIKMRTAMLNTQNGVDRSSFVDGVLTEVVGVVPVMVLLV